MKFKKIFSLMLIAILAISSVGTVSAGEYRYAIFSGVGDKVSTYNYILEEYHAKEQETVRVFDVHDMCSATWHKDAAKHAPRNLMDQAVAQGLFNKTNSNTYIPNIEKRGSSCSCETSFRTGLFDQNKQTIILDIFIFG